MAVSGGRTEYTLEADLDLVLREGVEEVEPFRATVAAESVDDAIAAFRRVAHERLVETGPFVDVRCPAYPGYGDYRFVDPE
ncbi:hypothetical protein [Halomarina rubra]|uniref:Uncharacterized protein n=1 Tax=Halomarina rubra TaxID=2071873 RepID=A0ABD6AYA8_9EURY|nr:hypothetical protein [Halomarina rubra]